MLRSSVPLLIILIVLIVAFSLTASAPAYAADPVATCQGMKIKASGKRTYDKAKCHQKAVAKGVAVDPECLSKAETKFTAAIAKADAAGVCAGDAATLAAAVDGCVTDYRDIVQPPATTTTSTTTTSTVPGAVCGNGLVEVGEGCDDNDNAPGDGCDAACAIEGGYSCAGEPSVCTASALYFTEYVEGSSADKAVEILNPAAGSVPLAGCSVRVYTNGSASVSSEVMLMNTVAAGDVYVLCNNSPSGMLAPLCDQFGVIPFNGDDAIELQCNGTTLDVIGQIGFDPGAQWGTPPTVTQDQTLRRKCSVTTGDQNGADAFDPAIEWGAAGVDVFSDLGVATCVP